MIDTVEDLYTDENKYLYRICITSGIQMHRPMSESTIKTEKCASNTEYSKNGRSGSGPDRRPRKAQNLEKRLFSLPYISHNVHYTKSHIIKNRTPFPVFAPLRRSYNEFSGGGLSSAPLYALWFSDAAAGCFSVRLTAAAADRFQNTGRLPRNRSSLPFCTLLRCQTVPRLPRWSQSTALPALPDS